MNQVKTKRKGGQARKNRFPWPMVMVLGGLALVAAVIAGSLLNKPEKQTEESVSGTPSLKITEINSSPEAQIDGEKVDFGDLKLGGELASLKVMITNNGGKVLRFTQEPYIQLAEGC